VRQLEIKVLNIVDTRCNHEDGIKFCLPFTVLTQAISTYSWKECGEFCNSVLLKLSVSWQMAESQTYVLFSRGLSNPLCVLLTRFLSQYETEFYRVGETSV